MPTPKPVQWMRAQRRQHPSRAFHLPKFAPPTPSPVPKFPQPVGWEILVPLIFGPFHQLFVSFANQISACLAKATSHDTATNAEIRGREIVKLPKGPVVQASPVLLQRNKGKRARNMSLVDNIGVLEYEYLLKEGKKREVGFRRVKSVAIWVGGVVFLGPLGWLIVKYGSSKGK